MRKTIVSLLLLCLLVFSSMSHADRTDIPPLFELNSTMPPGQILLLK